MDQSIKILLILTALAVLIYVIYRTSSNKNSIQNKEEYKLPTYSEQEQECRISSRPISYRQTDTPIVFDQNFGHGFEPSANVSPHNSQQKGPVSLAEAIVSKLPRVVRSSISDILEESLKPHFDNNSEESSDSLTVSQSETSEELKNDAVDDDSNISQEYDPNDPSNRINPVEKIDMSKYIENVERYDISNHKIEGVVPNLKHATSSYNDTEINGDSIYESNNIVQYCTLPNEKMQLYTDIGDDERIVPMNDSRFNPYPEPVNAYSVVSYENPDEYMESIQLNLNASPPHSCSKELAVKRDNERKQREMTMKDEEYYKMVLNRPNLQIQIEEDCENRPSPDTPYVLNMEDMVQRYRQQTRKAIVGSYRDNRYTTQIRNGARMYDVVSLRDNKQ